jgi:cell volume regulation protein A
LSLVLQGTTLPFFARKLGLSAPLEKTGNDFGVELPDEIDTELTDLTVTPAMIEEGNTLKEMTLPDGALVMIVKRGKEFLVPNGSLHLQVGDKLLLISEGTKD